MAAVVENSGIPVLEDPDGFQEVRKRYGLTREIPSNPRELIRQLDCRTFCDVVPRPERSAFNFDRDQQSDDAKVSEIHRSALLVSIEEAGEILTPVEVDEGGRLLDGYRRVSIAQALGLEAIPVVVLTGWRDDPLQALEQKRDYIREVNTTGRTLSLYERKEMARKLLGEDEERIRKGEVRYRQSYGVIAAQTGLSQHTVELLERDHFYLRFRARCEGEQRLRGDGRLRSTTPIPPEGRLDEQDAWLRGLPDSNRKRSLAGLQEAARERRQRIERLPEGYERQEREALLEDALAILKPVMIALDQEREKEKKQQEARARARAETDAKREADAKATPVETSTADQPAGAADPTPDEVGEERSPERPDAREKSQRCPLAPTPLERHHVSIIQPTECQQYIATCGEDEDLLSRPITTMILEQFATLRGREFVEQDLEDETDIRRGTIAALRARKMAELSIPDLDKLAVWLRGKSEGTAAETPWTERRTGRMSSPESSWALQS